jgi:hypothetical protein
LLSWAKKYCDYTNTGTTNVVFNSQWRDFNSSLTHILLIPWPVGLMDKASASGAGDSRFESWAGHIVYN